MAAVEEKEIYLQCRPGAVLTWSVSSMALSKADCVPGHIVKENDPRSAARPLGLSPSGRPLGRLVPAMLRGQR